MAETGPIRAFLSYAHEDHGWRDRVLKHLGWLRNSGRLEHFDDRQLKPGEAWDTRIQAELLEADIVIVLISPDFVGSAYCGLKELLIALERAERASARIVPIVCDHVDLGALPIAHLQCSPQDEQNDLKPLVDWPNFNVPLAAIAASIRGIVQELEAARSSATADEVAPEPPPRWSLPIPPPHCIGRAEPIGSILEALQLEPPDPIVLHGAAGIGKTTLALEAACHPDVVERFGDRRAYVALDKSADADAMMAAIRAALALPPGPGDWDDLEPLLEEDLILLVLDNLEMPWERAEQAVEGIIIRLAAIPSVLLIAAMRGAQPPASPGWKLALEVPPLAPVHARELLLARAPMAAKEPGLMEAVLTGLDGVPLAIELFAAQVAGQGSLQAAWQQWTSQRRQPQKRSAGREVAASGLARLRPGLAATRRAGPAPLRDPRPPAAGLAGGPRRAVATAACRRRRAAPGPGESGPAGGRTTHHAGTGARPCAGPGVAGRGRAAAGRLPPGARRRSAPSAGNRGRPGPGRPCAGRARQCRGGARAAAA